MRAFLSKIIEYIARPPQTQEGTHLLFRVMQYGMKRENLQKGSCSTTFNLALLTGTIYKQCTLQLLEKLSHRIRFSTE